MIKPFKEVILFDFVNDISQGQNPYYLHFDDLPQSKYKLKNTSVEVIWSGSIDEFKNDFEIPSDAPLSTKETKLPYGNSGTFVGYWDWTTLNFKFNYHVWYKDSDSNGYYVLGSNNTIDITIPNVLVFNGSQISDESIKYASLNNSVNRVYNPNLFPLPISINTFESSNKTNGFQTVIGSSTDSLVYLIFRFGVNNHDIEICLLTKDSPNFQFNNKSLYIPYASLTFTGFNKIKRL